MKSTAETKNKEVHETQWIFFSDAQEVQGGIMLNCEKAKKPLQSQPRKTNKQKPNKQKELT